MGNVDMDNLRILGALIVALLIANGVMLAMALDHLREIRKYVRKAYWRGSIL